MNPKPTTRRLAAICLLLPLLIACIPYSARAVNYTWALDGSGDWTTPSNWGSANYPSTTSDNATIRRDIAGNITATLDTPLRINNLTLGNNAGTTRLLVKSDAAAFNINGSFYLYNGGMIEIGQGSVVTNAALYLLGTNFLFTLHEDSLFYKTSAFSPVTTNATVLFTAPEGSAHGGTINGAGLAWNLAYSTVSGKNVAGTNNVWVFDNVTISNTPMTVSRSPSMNGATTVIFRNGARLINGTAQDFTLASASTNAFALIEGEGTVLTGPGRNLYIATGISSMNIMTVSNGGCVSNWGHAMIGRTGPTFNNTLEVKTGGRFMNPTGSLRICYQGQGTNNVVVVSEGGLIEAKQLWINYQPTGPVAANGIVVRDGGILQFPTGYDIILTSNAWARIANSSLSFRGTETADVYCNAAGSGVGLFVYTGNNAFRLNNAKNVATVTQTYTFAPVDGSPKTWGRLEMVDGATTYRGMAGDTLTIGNAATGAAGSMLCSNTVAAVSVPFTLATNGTLKVSNATLALTAGATFNGAIEIDLDHLADPNGILLANAAILGENSVLRLSGTGSETTLLTSDSPIIGAFASIEGIPDDYSVHTVDKTIFLSKIRGTVVVIR